MSKLKPPGVTIKITEYPDVDCATPMGLSASRGPEILNSPEEVDDITGEPRGTTRKLMRRTGLRRISVSRKAK